MSLKNDFLKKPVIIFAQILREAPPVKRTYSKEFVTIFNIFVKPKPEKIALETTHLLPYVWLVTPSWTLDFLKSQQTCGTSCKDIQVLGLNTICISCLGFKRLGFRWKEYVVKKYPFNVGLCAFFPEVDLEGELIYIRLKVLPSFCNTQTVNSGAKKKSGGVG